MRNRKGRYLQPRRPPHASRVQIRLVWTAASVATLARTRTSPGLASSLVTHIPFLVATPSASTISLMPPTTPNPYTTQVCAEDPYEVALALSTTPAGTSPVACTRSARIRTPTRLLCHPHRFRASSVLRGHHVQLGAHPDIHRRVRVELNCRQVWAIRYPCADRAQQCARAHLQCTWTRRLPFSAQPTNI